MAGFDQLFRDAAVLARSIAGVGLFPLCEYQPCPLRPGYDAESGRPVWLFTPDPVHNVPVMIADWSRREPQDTAIQDHDARAIIAALDLPGVTPKPGDLFRGTDGQVWEVVHALGDPAFALHDLHVRPYALGWPE